MEPRLQRRFDHLVREHLSCLSGVAAGLRALPKANRAFASTQAAWRFYHNPRLNLRQLAEPLLARARQGLAADCRRYGLVVHDWSYVHYNGHPSKKDGVALSRSHDVGYELQAALLLEDQHGQPLAPLYLGLRAADGVHSSLAAEVQPVPSQLDGLNPVLDFSTTLAGSKQLVHLIDAEADSVAHYRHWAGAGHRFLVRADAERVARYLGRERTLAAVAQSLRRRRQFRRGRRLLYEGKVVWQWVAEAAVTLTKPARPQRVGHKRQTIAGPALPLRLVVSELRDARGRVLCRWLLLTNVAKAVRAKRIALWYYWRWRVESYFKLLKRAGQHIEQWQQETAAAVARRLLVSSMACVVVWGLARCQTPQAARLRMLLVRLSGRQMHWGTEFTWPALLSGLWTLLAMLELQQQYDLTELRQLVDAVLIKPYADTS